MEHVHYFSMSSALREEEEEAMERSDALLFPEIETRGRGDKDKRRGGEERGRKAGGHPFMTSVLRGGGEVR